MEIKATSIYIHIPFCSSICSYCDFCKMFYNKKLVSKYLLELDKEINSKYKKKTVKTVYIGGGTPSCLNIEQLSELFDITNKIILDQEYEFTIECNISDISKEKLELFKKNNVNRISIGIETINEKYLSFLNRSHTKEDVLDKIELVKKYFDNINIDLMYAFPKQTLEELENDLEFVKEINVNHISTYSLIIEEHTKIYIDKIEPLDEELESIMYYHIIEYLENLGYCHYEISNFSKPSYESKHNLVYWNNEEYYGFGLGASGYIDSIRYQNTRSITNYLSSDYVKEECKIDKKTDMENYLILGLRKTIGVSKIKFSNKYNSNIEDNFDIIDLTAKGQLVENDEYICISKEMLYLSNSILINFIKE